MERWHGESVNHWKTRLKEYQYISCWITKVWHGCSSLHIDFRSQNTLHTSYLIFSPFAHQMEPQQDRGWWETTRVDRPMACGGFAISQHCTHIHNIGVIVRLTSVTATTYCFRHRAWMLASSLAQVSVVQTDGGRTVSFVGTHILSGETVAGQCPSCTNILCGESCRAVSFVIAEPSRMVRTKQASNNTKTSMAITSVSKTKKQRNCRFGYKRSYTEAIYSLCVNTEYGRSGIIFRSKNSRF